MTNPQSKLITGPLHADNKGASDWGYQGFIGYGCHRYVVVADPKTLQVIQTLGPHNSTVTHVKWAREKYHHAFATGKTYSLILAAADSGGNILIWDVVSGNIRTEFQRQPVHIRFLGLEWVPGHDDSHDLLLVLRYPGLLEMWDAYTGVQLWKKDFGENLLSFILDPFDINRLICLSEVTHLVLVSDVDATREPQADRFKYLSYSDPNPVVNSQSSLKRQSSGQKSPRRSSAGSWTKMANLATNMILPVSSSESLSKRLSISDDDQDTLSSCLQVVFSPIHNHIVLLVFSTEIQFMDVDVELVVGTLRLDRAAPFILKVFPCHTADMFFCLHENGSTTVRIRKQKNPESKLIRVFTSRGHSLHKNPSEVLDLTYELSCLSDSIRLLRQTRIVGFLCQPITEKQVSIHLSDSRIIVLDVMATTFNKDETMMEQSSITLGEMVNGLSVALHGNRTEPNQEEITLRMVVSGLMSGLNYPITCTCMRPSKATANEVGQHLAVGLGCGAVQLVNVYTGQVEYEYKLFSHPVRGMEWISASDILTYTYTEPSNYGNRGVKSEIIVLNTNTGEIDAIRGSGNNEGPVQFVKASPSGKFMAVAIKDKPIEIWNIKLKQLLKELTVLQHKPSYIAWHPSVTRVPNKDKENKSSIVEQLFITITYETGSIMRIAISDGVVKNVVFFTNEKVFGQTTGRIDIVALAWKETYLIIADKSGTIYLKNKSNARKIHEKLGMGARNIKFAPGKNNLKFMVLYERSIDIWELVNEKAEFVISSPSLNSPFIDATWTGPESVSIATDDFCLHIMKIVAKGPASPERSSEDDFIHIYERTMKVSSLPMQNWRVSDVFSPALLDRKTAFLLKYSLQCKIEPFSSDVQHLLQLVDGDLKIALENATTTADRCLLTGRLFGDEYDMEFWETFKYASKNGQKDSTCLVDVTPKASSFTKYTGNLEKHFDFSEWISKLLSSSSEVSDLLDLSTNDLETKLHLSCTTESEIDSSWVNGLMIQREQFIASSTGLLMKNKEFESYEASRLKLHNKKANSYRVKKVCASRYIMMNKVTMATQILMETDTDNLDFRHDCLKACLVSCVQPTAESLSTLKLAATHLIAAGHLQDGVDLLCMMNKQADACKYLITYGKWLDAVWLAKIGLTDKECLGVVCKFAEYLWQHSQKMRAVLVMMSAEQYATVLRMLFSLGQYDTAALFLQSCVEQGLLSTSEDTEKVHMEFAKFLFVTQYQSAVEHHCQMAGETGHSLLKEVRDRLVATTSS